MDMLDLDFAEGSFDAVVDKAAMVSSAHVRAPYYNLKYSLELVGS